MSLFKLFPTINYDLLGTKENYQVVDTFRSASIDSYQLDNYLVYRQYIIEDGDRPDIVSTKLYGTPDYHWTFAIINDFLRDGYQYWPLSTYQLKKFSEKYLYDTVIQVRPFARLDPDGLFVEMENSFVGKYDYNELILGYISGARGYVKSFDFDLQQMLLRDVEGVFQRNELIIGNETGDTVTSFKVSYLKDAICEYRSIYTDKVETNALFYPEGTTNANLKGITYFEKLNEINQTRSKIKIILPEYITEFADKFKEKINE